jgi:outer membrane protein TolC
MTEALRSNLGLKLLSLQSRASEKLAAAAKSHYYGKPDLGLFLELAYGGSAFPLIQDEWKDKDDYNFTATLGIRSLLFDGGVVHHTIKQKQEDLVQARLEEDKGRRDLAEYMEKTLYRLDVSKQRQEYLALKVTASAGQKDRTESAMKSGYGGEREYLIRELTWYGDRIKLLQEELNACLTILQLENVIGR